MEMSRSGLQWDSAQPPDSPSDVFPYLRTPGLDASKLKAGTQRRQPVAAAVFPGPVRERRRDALRSPMRPRSQARRGTDRRKPQAMRPLAAGFVCRLGGSRRGGATAARCSRPLHRQASRSAACDATQSGPCAVRCGASWHLSFSPATRDAGQPGLGRPPSSISRLAGAAQWQQTERPHRTWGRRFVELNYGHIAAPAGPHTPNPTRASRLDVWLPAGRWRPLPSSYISHSQRPGCRVSPPPAAPAERAPLNIDDPRFVAGTCAALYRGAVRSWARCYFVWAGALDDKLSAACFRAYLSSPWGIHCGDFSTAHPLPPQTPS